MAKHRWQQRVDAIQGQNNDRQGDLQGNTFFCAALAANTSDQFRIGIRCNGFHTAARRPRAGTDKLTAAHR